MAHKKFDKIFYRPAAAPIDSIAFTGATPAHWTALPAEALVDTGTLGIEPAATTELNDGTTYTGSDKADISFSFIGLVHDTYTTVRNAFLNICVDVIMIDSAAKNPAFCIWGARLYPKLSAGDTTPSIIVSGSCERSSEAAKTPGSIIKVT